MNQSAILLYKYIFHRDMAYMYVYELHVDLIHSRWARSASASHIHIARWANNKADGRTNWQAGRQAFDDGDCLRFLETQTVMQNHFVLFFFETANCAVVCAMMEIVLKGQNWVFRKVFWCVCCPQLKVVYVRMCVCRSSARKFSIGNWLGLIHGASCQSKTDGE